MDIASCPAATTEWCGFGMPTLLHPSGLRLMDTAIQALMDQRQITGKEAFKKAINKARFEQFREAS